jgi:mono/diheme cytochrome c family protein
MTIKGVVTLAALALLAAVLFIWFGVFDISATHKHWGVTTKLLDVVRERSIEVRSKDIQAPSMDAAVSLPKGAKNYDAMCAQCHLAPKMKPTELNLGLYPQPPLFYNSDEEPDLAATYWTIKNGLKLTGMPAWGAFHTEQQIWELALFVTKLKGMSEAEYKELVGEGGHSHAGGEEHAPDNHDASEHSHAEGDHH